MTDLREQLQQSLGSSYTIERELGGGGMSRVFVAEETRFRRKVVVKLLSAEIAQTVSLERFEREVMLAAQLQHANIVPVITAGDVAGLPYYTMPFVEGESLRTRLVSGALPIHEAVAVLKDVARALAYAHQRGVVHRDIKPENVLLSGGAAVVTDFGIAKAISASKTRAPGGTLTVVGTSLGTPAYMAPEQAVGDEVDHRADIYAWGVVAYEIIAGAHPFKGKTTAQQLIAAHIAEKPAPIGRAVKGVPAELATLIMSALEKSPGMRPGSAQEIVAALENPSLIRTGVGRTSIGWRVPERIPARRIALGALVALLLIGIVAGRDRIASWVRSGGPTTTKTRAAGAPLGTIAVLPFVNTGGNAQDEYFSDGITDELAHALSRLPSIRVAARTSTYAFKGKSASVQDIGRTLNVAGVVEGTVRRAGDRLRVTAQLTSAADGLVLWSDTYESRATDVFQIQDEFTKAIVSALAPTLGGTSASGVASASRGTDDAEAYELFLKGKYFWAKRGGRSLTSAVGYFRRAIAKDPAFARAHAGLAIVYAALPGYVAVNTDSIRRLAIETGNGALALDSTLVDAHLALGNAFMSRLRFIESERHFRTALALEPENATAHQWYGINLLIRGKIDEAVAEFRRATELDPLSVVVGGNLALGLYVARQFPQSIAQSRKMLDLDSTNYTASYLFLGLAHLFNGSADSGVRALETLYRLEPRLPSVRGFVLFGYAAAGRWADAARLKATIERERGSLAYHLDVLYSSLAFGDRDAAFAAIERTIRRGETSILLTSFCEPTFDFVRSDPRFTRMMQRVGVDKCPAVTPWPIKPRPNNL